MGKKITHYASDLQCTSSSKKIYISIMLQVYNAQFHLNFFLPIILQIYDIEVDLKIDLKKLPIMLSIYNVKVNPLCSGSTI